MEVGTDMPLRRQDRRGDRADRRTPPGIYPLEPDRWRLLWHVIVTVLLLAALASTAPGSFWIPCDQVRLIQGGPDSSSLNHPVLRTLGHTVRLLLKGCQFKVFGRPLRDMQHDRGADRT
jgi:hypothetical protein